MGRLIFDSRVIVALFFFFLPFAPEILSDVGKRMIDDRPISQFMHCEEIVELSRSGGRPFGTLTNQDPWKLWLALELWKKHYTEKIEDPELFKFSVEGKGYHDYVIKATSLLGGRGYIYDPRWLCRRLVFTSDQERELLAHWIKKYFTQGLDSTSELHLFLAIPFPHGIAHPPEQPIEKATAQRLFAAYLGDFLPIEHMREFIYDVAFDHSDLTTRENCIRSILSVFESLPEEVRSVLKTQVNEREAILKSSANKDSDWAKRERNLLSYLRKKILADDSSLVSPNS